MQQRETLSSHRSFMKLVVTSLVGIMLIKVLGVGESKC